MTMSTLHSTHRRGSTARRPTLGVGRCAPVPGSACTRCLAPVDRLHRYCARCGLRLASPSGPAGRSMQTERRTVSVLFVDMVGFTELCGRLDPEDVRRLQVAYFHAVAAVIRRWHGVVEKYIGDAVMAVFGGRDSDDQDAYRAVRAATQLPEAVRQAHFPSGVRVRIRVGVATGEAVVDLARAVDGGYGFLTGDVVNIASRLQAHAAVGTVAVTAATRRATGSLIRYQALGLARVAGKTEPLEIWRPVCGVLAGTPHPGGSDGDDGHHRATARRDRGVVRHGRPAVRVDGADRGDPRGRRRHLAGWRAGAAGPAPAVDRVERVEGTRRSTRGADVAGGDAPYRRPQLGRAHDIQINVEEAGSGRPAMPRPGTGGQPAPVASDVLDRALVPHPGSHPLGRGMRDHLAPAWPTW